MLGPGEEEAGQKMAAEPGPGASEAASMAVGPPAEVEQLRAYLIRLVPVMLEEGVLPDTTALEQVVQAADVRLRKFIEDPQERSLFVLRTLPPEEEGEGGSGEATTFLASYELRLGLKYRPARTVGVALIKRGPILEADKSVRAQLRVINFTDDSPFETLHSYVRDAVTPYFSSYVQTSKKSGCVPGTTGPDN